MLANVAALVVGALAVVDNRGSFIRNDGFIRIMMATRNPELDELVGQLSDGTSDDDQQARLESQEVKFGYLLKARPYQDGRRMVGFGLPDSVVSLKESR